jgi:chromosome segregation ATPase
MSVRPAKNLKLILTVLLVGVTIFSVFKYVMTLKEKYALQNSLKEAKEQAVALELAIEKERELHKSLAQENLTLKDELKANTDKLAQLDAELQDYQKTIERLTSEVGLAKAENTALREEKDNLVEELNQVSQERDTLKARLGSMPELKKTIREVKVQIRKAKVRMREISKKRRVIEGNRGFLVKNGRSTYPVTKIEIEVLPAPAAK